MRWMAAALLLMAAAGEARAREAGQLGVGFIAGTPIGFSAKYYATEKFAFDMAFGVDTGDFNGHADVLILLDRLLPQPERGKLPLYLGMGVKVRDEVRNLLGIRFVAGASYHFPNHPLEIFAEIAPVLRLKPTSGTDVDGGVGLRYYFNVGGRGKSS